MNQEDIFKLLLIVLLLANREIDRTKSENAVASGDAFSYSSLNDILILVMLLNGFSSPSPVSSNSGTTF